LHGSSAEEICLSVTGVLFCVGGRGTSGTPFKTIECYDPRKNRWMQIIEMSTRRRHVGVVAMAGRYILVVNSLVIIIQRHIPPMIAVKRNSLALHPFYVD